MADLDYNKIDLKIGLEIHQELSGTKLFCSCSTDLKEKNKIMEFMRKIRASSGEIGEIDIASLYEQEKNKEFIYYGYENEFCLVEADEEPPHGINQEALKTALGVATFLKLEIPDSLIVMRKVITDGSVVSGFQRSALIAIGTEESTIETSLGKVRIKDLYLEEDSAKIIKEEGNKVSFSLSRAGIPLLEIGTYADIKTPEQAREAAEAIGLILRSFPNMKRGIGVIRQDINLSIKNMARVELKGFQDIRMMTKVIENEVKRQLSLISENKKVEPEVRRVNPDGTTSFLRPIPGAARLYPDTDINVIEISKELLKEIRIPELITEKIIKLEKKYNLTYELAKQLVNNKYFLDLVNKFKKIEPNFIAKVLIEMPKEIKARYNLILNIDKDFEFILNALNKDEIAKEAVFELLLERAQGKRLNIAKYKKLRNKEIERLVKDFVEKNISIIKEKGERSVKVIMGSIMENYRGRLDSSLVFKLVKDKVDKMLG